MLGQCTVLFISTSTTATCIKFQSNRGRFFFVAFRSTVNGLRCAHSACDKPEIVVLEAVRYFYSQLRFQQLYVDVVALLFSVFPSVRQFLAGYQRARCCRLVLDINNIILLICGRYYDMIIITLDRLAHYMTK